jgi:hypothetical protein
MLELTGRCIKHSISSQQRMMKGIQSAPQLNVPAIIFMPRDGIRVRKQRFSLSGNYPLSLLVDASCLLVWTLDDTEVAFC